MKNLFCLLFVLAAPYYLMAQKIDSAALSKLTYKQSLEVDSLLKKKKSYRTGAIVLVGLGSLVCIGGFASLINETNNDLWFDGEEPNYAPGLVLMAVGISGACISIPLFRKSATAGRKANAIVFGSPSAQLAPGIKLPRSSSPAVGISIPIGR